MRKKKQRGPATGESTGPKRLAKAKHVFKVSRKKLESQEGKLFLDFLRDYPPSDGASLASLELLWAFIIWLKSKSYFIIPGNEVYCFPISKLVRLKGLK